MPGVPTFAEASIDARLKSPDAARHIAHLGFEAAGGGAADYAKFLGQEIETAHEIIQKAHITTGD